MSFLITDIRKKLLFGFYILVLGIILLYVLFPDDAVRNHLINRINQNVSEAQVSVASLRLGFPASLTFREVTISKNGAVLLFMDRLKLSPRFLSLLSSRKKFMFKGQTCQGNVSGSFWISSKNDSIEASASGNFSEIRLEQVPVIKDQSRMDIAGALSGNFQAAASSTEPASGSANIDIAECNLTPPVPLLNIQKLEFQHVGADFDFEGKHLEILSGVLEGTEFNGSVSGSIYFKSPVSGSELELDIDVIPLISSETSEINGLTIRATGTFENPNFSTVPSR